jgi:hypothetical protein
MKTEKALDLSQVLTPLFHHYGLTLNGSERISRRPCKHEASYQAWSSRFGLAAFVYDDASVGLRDGNISMIVELDINMADPQSLRRLEDWLKSKRKEYDTV